MLKFRYQYYLAKCINDNDLDDLLNQFCDGVIGTKKEFSFDYDMNRHNRAKHEK